MFLREIVSDGESNLLEMHWPLRVWYWNCDWGSSGYSLTKWRPVQNQVTSVVSSSTKSMFPHFIGMYWMAIVLRTTRPQHPIVQCSKAHLPERCVERWTRTRHHTRRWSSLDSWQLHIQQSCNLFPNPYDQPCLIQQAHVCHLGCPFLSGWQFDDWQFHDMANQYLWAPKAVM